MIRNERHALSSRWRGNQRQVEQRDDDAIAAKRRLRHRIDAQLVRRIAVRCITCVENIAKGARAERLLTDLVAQKLDRRLQLQTHLIRTANLLGKSASDDSAARNGFT